MLATRLDVGFVLDLGLNSAFRLVLDPLAYKELSLRRVELAALTFLHVSHPLPFVMIFIAACHDPVSAALPLLPLSFVDISVVLDHAAFTVRPVFNPEAVITVTVRPEHGSFALSHSVVPVTCL